MRKKNRNLIALHAWKSAAKEKVNLWDCLSWAFESNSLSRLFKFSKFVSQSFFFFCRVWFMCLQVSFKVSVSTSKCSDELPRKWVLYETLFKECSNKSTKFVHVFVFPYCWPLLARNLRALFSSNQASPSQPFAGVFPRFWYRQLVLAFSCGMFIVEPAFFLIGPRHLNYYKKL